ncbi:uncharacterized protein LOC143231594 isoform X3 [Tachypleus tridentatus]|uniref:uncharacterized protein LOC143231594 isoform X3 n=1 Tax=Tachypleus tridentatus TaxID=6853 RepID=UPI003FD5FB8E
MRGFHLGALDWQLRNCWMEGKPKIELQCSKTCGGGLQLYKTQFIKVSSRSMFRLPLFSFICSLSLTM